MRREIQVWDGHSVTRYMLGLNFDQSRPPQNQASCSQLPTSKGDETKSHPMNHVVNVVYRRQTRQDFAGSPGIAPGQSLFHLPHTTSTECS